LSTEHTTPIAAPLSPIFSRERLDYIEHHLIAQDVVRHARQQTKLLDAPALPGKTAAGPLYGVLHP
jgi:hypothetical protein